MNPSGQFLSGDFLMFPGFRIYPAGAAACTSSVKSAVRPRQDQALLGVAGSKFEGGGGQIEKLQQDFARKLYHGEFGVDFNPGLRQNVVELGMRVELDAMIGEQVENPIFHQNYLIVGKIIEF